MRVSELIRYSREKISGRRGELLLVCMIPLGGELFLLLSEAAIYCIMLYFGGLKPVMLFTAESFEQTMLAAIFALIRLIFMPPLWCAAAVRIVEISGGSVKKTAVTDMLTSFRFQCRSIGAFLIGRLISAIFLTVPLMLFSVAVHLLSEGGGWADIAIAVNTAAAAVVAAIFWLGIRLSLTALPFLMAEQPEAGVWRTVFGCLRFMHGRRSLPLTLICVYAVPILFILPSFYFIPELAAAYATGISIYTKEDEYNVGAEIQSKLRKADRIEKISERKLRRIARASAKAEKP